MAQPPIQINPAHRGLLHAELGVPQDRGISLAQLQKAKATADPAEQKSITFAQNARTWRKVGG